jgi:hypothetical protein
MTELTDSEVRRALTTIYTGSTGETEVTSGGTVAYDWSGPALRDYSGPVAEFIGERSDNISLSDPAKVISDGTSVSVRDDGSLDFDVTNREADFSIREGRDPHEGVDPTPLSEAVRDVVQTAQGSGRSSRSSKSPGGSQSESQSDNQGDSVPAPSGPDGPRSWRETTVPTTDGPEGPRSEDSASASASGDSHLALGVVAVVGMLIYIMTQ